VARGKKYRRVSAASLCLVCGLICWIYWPLQAPVPALSTEEMRPLTAVAAVPPSLLARMQAVAAPAQSVPPAASSPSPPPSPSAPKSKPQPRKKTEPSVSVPSEHSFSAGRPAVGGQQPAGEVLERRGQVPELSVELAGHDAGRVAAHYGLVLAAHSHRAGALLGAFDGGRLVPLPEKQLAAYASRGRSAEGLKDAFELVAAAAHQSGRDFDDIGLLYLVPRAVDSRWTQWQRKIVQQAGYRLEQVRVVRARYGVGMRLEVRALELHDGKVVDLEVRG
jgi:hypothetical protein